MPLPKPENRKRAYKPSGGYLKTKYPDDAELIAQINFTGVRSTAKRLGVYVRALQEYIQRRLLYPHLHYYIRQQYLIRRKMYKAEIARAKAAMKLYEMEIYMRNIVDRLTPVAPDPGSSDIRERLPGESVAAWLLRKRSLGSSD